MALIISKHGDLKPEDEYPHPLGPEPNFNESMYFNFFDREQSTGGFLRLGNRANEGYAEMTAAVFLTDGRVLFSFARPKIDGNDAFDAGGMRFDVIEPAARLRTRFDGSVVELSEPRAMSNPRKAFTECPHKQLSVDLLHEAVGPMYGTTHAGEEAGTSSDKQFAKAHYEQHVHVSGALVVDDERIEIDGYGLRDHSWGPRYWQAIDGYEWLTMNFGADFGAMVNIIRRAGGEPKVAGVIVRGNSLDPIRNATIEVDYEDNGLYHRALEVEIDTASGEHLRIDGSVKSFLPLRNRRESMTTHVGEGMTEWRCGDRTGYGLSELLRQVP